MTTRPVDDVELPEGCPVIVVADTLPVLGKLANAFCDKCDSEPAGSVALTICSVKTDVILAVI